LITIFSICPLCHLCRLLTSFTSPSLPSCILINSSESLTAPVPLLLANDNLLLVGAGLMAGVPGLEEGPAAALEAEVELAEPLLNLL